MKNKIIISILYSFVMLFLSLFVIRVDLSFHDVEKQIVFDLHDEYHFVINKTEKINTCDVICPVFRGYPFKMRKSSPVLHYDMRWLELNILYNVLIYFLISLSVLFLRDSISYIRNKWKN